MKSTHKKKKCTWSTPEFCVGDPTRPIFHLFALGVGIGGNTNFSFLVGGKANFTNMLVLSTRIFVLGEPTNAKIRNRRHIILSSVFLYTSAAIKIAGE